MVEPAGGRKMATAYCLTCGEPIAYAFGACTHCGTPPPGPAKPLEFIDYAPLWQRILAAFVDGGLSLVPYLGSVVPLVNLIAGRRGQSIGLALLRVRIVRDKGDVSGFFHTFARGVASLLSALPLGLGYAWALWDDDKQTWHDKLLRTYVVKDTPDLAARAGTSSAGAVVTTWIVVGLIILAALIALAAGSAFVS